MLKIDNLVKNYPDFRVSVDFSVSKGEFFSLRPEWLWQNHDLEAHCRTGVS